MFDQEFGCEVGLEMLGSMKEQLEGAELTPEVVGAGVAGLEIEEVGLYVVFASLGLVQDGGLM